MSRMSRHGATPLLISTSWTCAWGQTEISINGDIRPILSDMCFHSHGPDAGAWKIRLSLDSEAASKSDRGGRFAIAPSPLEKSERVRQITVSNAAIRILPAYSGSRLNDCEASLLKRWIASGAITSAMQRSFASGIRLCSTASSPRSWARSS